MTKTKSKIYSFNFKKQFHKKGFIKKFKMNNLSHFPSSNNKHLIPQLERSNQLFFFILTYEYLFSRHNSQQNISIMSLELMK